jgi:ArsR family transcriptional regulator
MSYMKMLRTPCLEDGKNTTVRVEISSLYDLFLSLFMAGTPGMGTHPSFLRSWKSRLSPRGRKAFRFFFESEEHLGLNALSFALRLPRPRSIEGLLTLLRAIPPDDFAVTVVAALEPSEKAVRGAVAKIFHQEPLTEEERVAWDDVRERFNAESLGRIDRLLRDPSLQEELASLLEEHYRIFYKEEAVRLLPALEESAQFVQVMATNLSASEIIATVARGLVLPTPEGKRVTFAPSFYAAPYVFTQESEEEFLLVFPAGKAMVEQQAGEVKAELLRSLKALADPTRLEILRMLSRRDMYALEISRALRLSHPTVLHHMAALRVGGYVQTEIRQGNNYYVLRNERLGELRLILERYLTSETENVDNGLHKEVTKDGL